MELIQEFKNYLLSQKKQPSKATVKNYVADVKKFIAWAQTKLNRPFLPTLITKELIQDYKAHQTSVFSASSLDRQMSSLRKFFEFLKLEGKVGINPFEAITIKQPLQDPWHLKEFKDFLYVYNASHLTIKNYLIDVKQFFSWAEQVIAAGNDSSADHNQGKLPPRNILERVTDKMLEEYSQRLLHDGNFSPSSINRKLSSLRKYLTWAHDQGWLSPEVTTLPANVTHTLLNEARSDEENANSGISNFTVHISHSTNDNVEAPESEQGWKEANKARGGTNETLVFEDNQGVARDGEPLKVTAANGVNDALFGAGERQGPASLNPDSVKNTSGEAVKTYSKIPPVRLFQKLGALTSLGLEYAVVIPLAHTAALIKHRMWILKGKPVFTRTDVKLPAKLQPFKSRVKNISKSFYNPLGISIAHFPWHKKVLYHIQYTRPGWYHRYNRLPAARYFNLAILMIFCAMIGFGLYSSFFSNARKNPTLAALPTAPPRVLSFQGRLTDNNDNPITTANTHLRFAIYNDATATGSALLWQEVQDVNPDTDGDFSTILGNKTTIPSTVFAQNNALWLGVTVQTTDELTPRQQIATVAFASNSETLQGLPPITAAGAGTQNVVLALDSGGNLGIAASTTFQSTSGTFTLSGNTVVLNTNTGTNGNITLAPDGYGTVDLQKPLQNSTLNNNISSAAGSVEVDDLLSVLATSSGQSAFTINQNSTGPLISASTSGVAKFTVDNSGNVTAAGNVTGQTIYAGGGTSYYINSLTSNLNSLTLASNLTVSGNVASDLIPALPTDTYSLGDASHEWNNLYVKNLVVNGSAFAQYWQLINSVLFPAVTTNDFAVGGNSTSSAKFQVFATSAGAQPAGTASTSGNFTFNGTTNPAKINLLNGANLGFYSATSGKGDAGLSSTPTLYVANAGNVGIGNNSPSYSLDVTGSLRVTSAGGFGGALPGATVQGQTSSLAVTGYTGLGGLRINGANTADTIYNGTSNIFVTRDTGGYLGLTQTSTPSIGLLVNTTTGGVGINTGTTGIGNGQLVVNQSNISGLGDVIAASAAGTPVFKVSNAGDVTASQFVDLQNTSYFLDPAATGTSLAVAGGIGVGGATPSTFKVQVAGDVGPNTNNAYDLGSYASNLQWRSIYGEHIFADGTELTQYWQRNSGALSPLFITDDLLLGATSTTSAKFAVTNIATGIPTASLSAGLNSGTYLTADGTLGTRALQPLTLGSSTTGNINLGTNAISQAIILGGTSQTGMLTLGQSTASNTINIGNNNTTTGNTQTINIGAGTPAGTGNTAITIGNNLNTSSLTLAAGTGNMTLTGATTTNYSIGDTTSTGTITLGQSATGQTINIGSNSFSNAQTIRIGNGASTGNEEVDILSGIGTGGTSTLKLGNNPRIQTIDLGNVAPSAARTITIAGGNAAQNDTLNILNGNPSAGTQTVSILAGTATGGTQNLNLGSNTSTTTIKGTNFTAGGVAYATSNTLNFVTGSEGQCLLSHTSSAPTFGLCTYGNGNYWDLQQGALFPINATLDFLIGANAGASSSAKFAVTNIAGTTPYASVSATVAGGGTGTGISLGGDGSIQSLIKGTLTLGGNSTGNIVLKPSNGVGGTVTLSGYSTGILHSTSGTLTASAVDLASADVTGILPKANGGTGNSTYTNGDMLYYDSGTSTTALTKLGIGADNSILNVDSVTHLPKWTSSPTLSGLTVSGTTTLNTIASSVVGGSGTVLNPITNGTLDLGDSTHYFGTIYASNIITPVGNGTQGFWQLNNDVISPLNSFYDLVVGGSATSSATPWQVFSSTVGVNTAGTATSSAGLTFRASSTQIAQLNGGSIVFKTSPGGDTGLTTALTINNNGNLTAAYGATVANDLAVNGSNLTSTTSNFNLLNTNVTNLNFAGAVSSLTIARGSSTTVINGNVELGTSASSNTVKIYGNFISNLQPNVDNTYDLGSNTATWRNAYINNVFGNATTGTQGYWQVNTNVISPAFNWQDLGLGGTSTASAKFQVYGSQFANGSSLNSGLIPAGTATSSGFLTFRGGATNVNLLNNSSLGFYTSVGGDAGLTTATNPSLFIANNGNNGYVGIGTSNPTGILHLASSAVGGTQLKIENDDTGGHIWRIISTGTGNSGGAGLLAFSDETGGGTRLAINTNGSVGIGTTTPLATLDIRGNSGTTPVASISGQTSNAGLIVNNDGVGDIFTASSSGWTRFTIAQDGTIKNNLIPNITDTYSLGSDPSLGGKEWDTLYVRQVVTPTGTLGSNYWQLSINGTLAPIKSWYDLAIGGNSTSSATFQVFGASYTNDLGTVPSGTATTSGNLTFRGTPGSQTAFQTNILNGASLGFYTSVGGDKGITTSNPALFIAANNNVGIGTTSPNDTLDIIGTGSTTSSLSILGNATSGNAIFTLQNSNLLSANLWQFSNRLEWVFNNFPSNNRLDLSTAIGNPTISFNPRGTVYFNTGTSVDIGTTTLNNAALVVNQTNSYGLGDIFTASTSGSTKFVITNDGNVGIGNLNQTNILAKTGLQISKDSLGNTLVLLNQLGNAGDFIAASDSAGMTQFKVDKSGIITANSFVDNQNTSYYLDPAATATSLKIAGTASSAADLTFFDPNGSTPHIKVLNGNDHIDIQNSVGGDVGAGGNTQFYLTTNGRAMFGYDSSNATIQAGSGHGIEFNVNNNTFGSGTAMFIDSSSNVGIGTTTPDTRLEVASRSAYTEILGSPHNAAIRILNTNTSNFNEKAELQFAVGGSINTTAAITALYTDWTSPGGGSGLIGSDLAFSTKTSTGLLTEAMRIKNNGNIGIGTTSPGVLLDVRGANQTITGNSGILGIYSTDSQAADKGGSIVLGGQDGASLNRAFAGIYGFKENSTSSNYNGYLAFATRSNGGNLAEAMRINSSGNVGIGTTNPGALLDIFDSNVSGSTKELRLYNDVGTPPKIHFRNGTSTTDSSVGQDSSGILYLADDAGTEWVQVNTNGVGIGSQPHSGINLDIGGNTNNIIRLQNNSTNSDSWLLKSIAGDSRLFFTGRNPSSSTGTNYVSFNTSGTVTSLNGFQTATPDYAEWIPVNDQSIESGDVLMADPNGIGSAQKASSPYQESLIGIVSTNPGFVAGGEFDGDLNNIDSEHKRVMALNGRVPTKVSTENGPIHVGDPLTSSSVPGVAMKATKAGPIIGKAMQDFDGSNATQSAQKVNGTWQIVNETCNGQSDCYAYTKITVFVNVSWYNPNDMLTSLDGFQTAVTNGVATVKDGTGKSIYQVGIFANAMIGNLQAGIINSQQVLTNSLAVATDNVSIAGQSLHDYIVNVVNQVLQTTSGNGTTSPIAEVDQLHTNLISPLASDSAITIDLQNSKVAVKNIATGQTVASIDNSGNATFSGTLTGQNLAVNGDATVSGILHADKIEANSIVGLQAAVGTLSAQNITNVTNIYMSSGSADTSRENSTTGSGTSGNNSNSLPNNNVIANGSEAISSNGYADIASFSAYLSYVPNLKATTGMFTEGLISLGPTTLTDTSVTGTLSIGSQMMLADNTINVLGSDLELQPLKQGGVAFVGGQVRIDTDGNLTVNGKSMFQGNLYASTISPLAGQDLNVQLGDSSQTSSSDNNYSSSEARSQKFNITNASGSAVLSFNSLGDIVASGAANIAKLNFNFVQPAMALSDTEVVATSSAGTAAIKQYQTQLTIDNKNVTQNSLIYITPVGNAVSTPVLLRQSPGKSFTVGIQVPSSQPVNFNWLIVN